MKTSELIAVDLASEASDNIKSYLCATLAPVFPTEFNSDLYIDSMMGYINKEILRVLLESRIEIEKEETMKCLMTTSQNS